MERGASARCAAPAILSLALLSAMAAPLPAAAQACLDQDCETDIPFGWDDEEALPPAAGSFPQGFVLTVPMLAGRRDDAPGPATLTRYAEVGTALGTCLAATLAVDQTGWRALTLRVSFKRDGTLNGVPRIPHISAAADAGAAARGREGVLAALSRCTPLPFSPALGEAVAGQIFAIRFIQQRNS